MRLTKIGWNRGEKRAYPPNVLSNTLGNAKLFGRLKKDRLLDVDGRWKEIYGKVRAGL